MKKETLLNEEISFFALELSLLLRTGISTGDALLLLSDEAGGSMKELLSSMASAADSGLPLSRIMEETGRFPSYVTGLTSVGEASGRLEESLAALARYYDARNRLDRQIRSALLYPALILFLMTVVIFVLLIRVLPVFQDVYASLGGTLTGVAGGLLRLGKALDAALPWLGILLASILAFWAAFRLSRSFRDRVLAVWKKRTGDKGIARLIHDARFAQSMAMCLSSGLPLEEALELSASLMADNPKAAARYRSCGEHLDQGASLSEALTASDALPPSACRLLALGIKSGNGDAVMEEISTRLSHRSEDALTVLLGRVEPTLVLTAAVLVGAILLSVMMPLLHIMNTIG